MASPFIANKHKGGHTLSTAKPTDERYYPSAIAFAICVAGIYGSYFAFGIIQQSLNEATFGEEKKKFKNTSFLLFLQCIGNCLCAWLVIKYTKQVDKTPFVKYTMISATYLGAMFSSNWAIQFISYPMKELAKACKPIPVLLMGVFVFGKHQTLWKYVCVFLVTIGISVYMWDEIAHSSSSAETSAFGIFLLFASLAMDGVTGPFQDQLVHQYRPSSECMMYYINLWASIFLLIILAITGQGLEGVQFMVTHKEVLPHIILFSVSSAIGQNFIYYTVERFGSLACSLITTTRKFFSILISSLWFAKPLTPVEWLGVFIVFTGLGIDIYSSATKKKKAE